MSEKFGFLTEVFAIVTEEFAKLTEVLPEVTKPNFNVAEHPGKVGRTTPLICPNTCKFYRILTED